ncbi:CHAT domain-containing protein [Mycena capillaripes]|nr:CHAT domain-containing protein [Mycena capillaripes]
MNSKELNEEIKEYRDLLVLHGLNHPDRGTTLGNLANALERRFLQLGEPKDINEVIDLNRELLQTPGHLDRGHILHTLATAVQRRFQMQRNSKDIDEAIELYQKALTLRAPPHPNRSSSLNNLALAVTTRFWQHRDPKDIDMAIELHREALALRSSPHPDRSQSLNNLAAVIKTRFQQTGDSDNIDEAIELHREALSFHEPGHPDRRGSLSSLAIAVWTRFEWQAQSKDIDEAIKLHKEALDLCAPHHPARSRSLNNLAVAMQTRFEQLGNPIDINMAIELHREALILHGPPHQDRSSSLINLGGAICVRFEQQGDLKDVDEAIELFREALTLCTPPHPNHGLCLNNLANAVQTRFMEQGGSKDLDEAIKLYRQALISHEPSDPDYKMCLNNLAVAIQKRFEQWGDLKDINEAIKLHREALARHPPPHPARSMSLNNLGVAVKMRFLQWLNSRDIDEAIELHREALSLHVPGHIDCGKSLNHLANAIQTRFLQRGDLKDINEAIELHRQALALYALPHPEHGRFLHNLAVALRARFDRQRDLKDITESIQHHRDGLVLRAPPHPDRGDSLEALALCSVALYEHTHDPHDLESSWTLFQEAATYMSSAPITRLHHAHSWARNAAKYNHVSSLTAYHTVFGLLSRLAALHLDLLSRQEILSTVSRNALTSASDAAACAVNLGQYNTAVEFLEAGRSVFWSRALHLRAPLNNLRAIRPELSAKLKDLSHQLEIASFRDTIQNRSTESRPKILSVESEGLRFRNLNGDWDKTVQDVRMLPGFEDFMGPKSMSALKQAVVSGPIIILVFTNSACSALILTLNGIQCLTLPNFTLPMAKLLADLSHALHNRAFNLDTFISTTREQKKYDSEDLAKLDTRLFMAREGNIKRSSDEVFQALLADLWKNIVKPVFDVLNLKKSVDPPRLWWCPTGPLTFLPIHAAGIYDKNITHCTSDYVVSSYTPTLTALLDPPAPVAGPFKITAVIEPNAPDCPPLPGARAELKKILTRIPNDWLTILINTEVETARIHLSESSIVHFACHGVQDKQPLESSLILTGGRLKVSEIMRRPDRVGDNAFDLEKPMSLAFLSACETAKGDKSTPDEAMHLAATLLFAGFRGVVATMWTINDLDGPKIADTFYEHLFKDCGPNSIPPVAPDLKQAAKALHLAVLKLREEPDISFQRWVPFVHYGL